MKAATIVIEGKVDELLAVLDRDVEHIQQNLSHLNELRSYVIKRDDAALGKLLESIQADSDDYRKHELKRQEIRKELANTLGCSPCQVTLSAIEAALPDEKKTRVARLKAKLGPLVKELKKEHLSTALLLSECARFNRVLLRSVFDLGKTVPLTYKPNGSLGQRDDAAFLNLKL